MWMRHCCEKMHIHVQVSSALEFLVLREAPNSVLECLDGLHQLKSLTVCCPRYYGPTELELKADGARDALNNSKYGRIARLTTLRSLAISSAYELSDGGLLQLTALTSLTRLSIEGCRSYIATAGGLCDLLPHLPDLRDLSISDIAVHDDTLLCIQQLARLTSLHIDDMQHVTHEGG